ncbi:unnamed protein product [Parajaminaea phylloscopi]
MKITIPFLVAILAVATSAQASKFVAQQKRCHPNDPNNNPDNPNGGPNPNPNGGPVPDGGTPVPDGGGGGGGGGDDDQGTSYQCGSSAVAGLLGLNLLNCLNLDILSSESKRDLNHLAGRDLGGLTMQDIAGFNVREIGGFTNHVDPVLEEMKKRAGIKPLCEDEDLATLKKDGLLDCKTMTFHANPNYRACHQVCHSVSGGLLAAVNLLNCANISILSNIKTKCPRGTSSEMPEGASEEYIKKRQEAEKRTDEIEQAVLPLLRRQLASRACERANEDLGVRLLDCHSEHLETRLLGGLLSGPSSAAPAQDSASPEGTGEDGDEGGTTDTCTSSASGIIGLNLLNCLDLSILSNESRDVSKRTTPASHAHHRRNMSTKKRLTA